MNPPNEPNLGHPNAFDDIVAEIERTNCVPGTSLLIMTREMFPKIQAVKIEHLLQLFSAFADVKLSHVKGMAFAIVEHVKL